MKKYLLLFFFFFSPLFAQDQVSICAIFENEAPYLREWIEYHHLLGVSRFYLYNNNSTDNYQEVLQPYIETGLVQLTEWPTPFRGDFPHDQETAYNDCIAKVRDKTRWLAIIDIDEFIVPQKHDTLPDLLANYENVGGLQIFWQYFGTSGYIEIPPHQTLVESLLMKNHRNARQNHNFKTIIRPDRIQHYAVHTGKYRPTFYGVFPNGSRGTARDPIQTDIVQINHYWTRDEKYFREKKVPRRERRENAKFSEERIQAIMRSMNHVEDDCILRFVPALRVALGL